MRVLTGHDDAAITDCLARDEFFWLDLVAPEPELLRSVGEHLGWNPLLIEDLQHGGQRPKVEDFAEHALVITYASVQQDRTGDVELLEHALVVHGGYLVTVRPTHGASFTRLRNSIAANGAGLSEGAVVHRVLDLIVDTTMEAAASIAADVDQLELELDSASSEAVLTELRSCRRDLIMLRSMVIAQRDALESLTVALDAIPGFDVGLRSHFRDVTDHARRVVDQVEISRDLLDGAFEAYYTTLVARQGAVSQRLTVIATIFLPLTFVTGFFGQNFAWMVEHVSSERDFLVFGVGATAVTGLLLAVAFRRLRWW